MLRTWGFDLTTKTVFSLDNVTEAHFTVPGQPNVDPELGLARHGQGVLLDERLEHPADLPARRHDRAGQLHAHERQDRDARLPDHDHPLAATTPPDAESETNTMSTKIRTTHDHRRGAGGSTAPVGARPRDTRPADGAGDSRRGSASRADRRAGDDPAHMGCSRRRPTSALAGTTFTLSGSGLPANKDVSIVWNTANVTWVVDARPDSVDYLGRKADKINVVLAQTKTDAQGAFSIKLRAPKDFGGIHDIYAVVDGVQVAKGGFLIARTATMTPKKGPIGTMITLTYSGLGSSLYEGGASMQYDNHYVGALMANWTRGVATVQFRAAGPVGRHTIEVADAISFDYLNIPQSPIPWATGHSVHVHGDEGRRAAEAAARLARLRRRRRSTRRRRWPRSAARAGKATATLSARPGPGPLEGRRLGERADAERSVSVVWSTVVGNRVNCSGHVLELRLGAARQRDGGSRRIAEEHGRRFRTASEAGT